MKQKFTLSDLKRNINESIDNDSNEQSDIVLKYGGKVFTLNYHPIYTKMSINNIYQMSFLTY